MPNRKPGDAPWEIMSGGYTFYIYSKMNYFSFVFNSK